MVKLGNFFFRYRNLIFPLFFILLVFISKPLASREHLENLRYAAGILIAIIGHIIRALTIGFAYIIRGGKNKKVYARTLVKNGIFAHCRNPLYLGNILIVIGFGIIINSTLFYFIGIPTFIFIYVAIIKAEEIFLVNKFGEEFTEYCRNVNRFMPNLSGIKKNLKGMKFNWSTLIVKEYGTIYMGITCMILLIMRDLYVQDGYEMNKTAIWVLSAVFIFVTFLYAVARYLKKSRRLISTGG